MTRNRSLAAQHLLASWPRSQLAAQKVMKDEGLVFSILTWLSLHEALRIWNVHRLFHCVLDGKVVPLLALQSRTWGIVEQYMDLSGHGLLRYEYNLETICIKALQCRDYEGLQLLMRRNFDFSSLRGHPQIIEFETEAWRLERLDRLVLLRALGFDLLPSQVQRQSPGFLGERSITVDFLGSRLNYRCSAMEIATSDYIERQLASLCLSKESLFRVPFVLAAFLHAGASSCLLTRVESSGYLLLLAIASESFNFVYLLVKEAIHLLAVLRFYRAELALLALRALETRRFAVLDLLRFTGFQLDEAKDQQWRFDEVIINCLLNEELPPVERLCQLGFSLARLTERKQEQMEEFLQVRLARGCTGGDGSAFEMLKKIASIDRSVLELHFRSARFLDFAGLLLATKSFQELRKVAQVHRRAFAAFFAANFSTVEAMLFDAFLLRNISLIADMASIAFPMAAFFERRQADLDIVLLGWLREKCWTELKMLKTEVPPWRASTFFNRNQEQTDAVVTGIIENGYWFDLHNLAQLSYDFEDLFERRFSEVSAAVLNFIALPQPHFVLLRELSGLGFPWNRFLQAHRAQISDCKDHDFLQFVISLDGFELGRDQKVYGLVEQTCRLYRSMAADMFKVGSDRSSGDVEMQEGVPENDTIEAEDLTMQDVEMKERPVSIRSGRRRPSAGWCAQDHIQPEQASQSSLSSGSRAPTQAASKEDAAEARLRSRALARRAQRKNLDVKQVLMLLICKGAYCWNPLKVDVDNVDSGKGFWPDVESFLSLLEAREDPAEACAVHTDFFQHINFLTHPGVVLTAANAAPGPNLAFLPPFAGANPHGTQVGQHYPFVHFGSAQMVPGHAAGSQSLFHVVCLAQRSEERCFAAKLELFWDILQTVLPGADAAIS